MACRPGVDDVPPDQRSLSASATADAAEPASAADRTGADRAPSHGQPLAFASALSASCAACLAPGGRALCAFSHHDPGKAPLDLAFFALAAEPPFALEATHVRDVRYERDVFVMGDGLDDERAIVHFYELRHRGGSEVPPS